MLPIKRKIEKYLTISAAIAALFLFISAIIAPIIIERNKKNWDTTIKEKCVEYSNVIQDLLDKKSAGILSASRSINSEIKNVHTNKGEIKRQLIQILIHRKEETAIQIYDSFFNLIAWSENSLYGSIDLKQKKAWIGQTFFLKQKLVTSLAFLDSIKIYDNNYYVIVNIPIQKLYKIGSGQNLEYSVTDTLSQILKTDVEINFKAESQPDRDGRKYSFPLLNNYKNKIGTVTFSKPSLTGYLTELQDQINITQYVLVLIIVILSGFIFQRKFKQLKSRFLRVTILSIYLIGFRTLLFVFEIPAFLFNNSLTDSSNFSSRFVFGIVRSPLELLITSVTLLLITIYIYRKAQDYFLEEREHYKSNWLKFISYLLPSIVISMLLWRGFGASIKSVIFDSTLRYFKEFSLVASPVVWVMCLNILVIGLIVFLSVFVLFIISFKHYSFLPRKNQKIIFWIVLLLIQISAWLYDLIQRDPQGTPLIRVVFFTTLFIILYQITLKRRELVYKVFLYSITASVISVSLLTYYNSELEKESLKITAYDLTRINEDQIQFIVYQASVQIANSEYIREALNEGEDKSTIAFRVWTNTQLHKERLQCNISVYDKNKVLVSELDANSKTREDGLEKVDRAKETIWIEKIASPYRDEITFNGYAKISSGNRVLGYVIISVELKREKYVSPNIPKILIPERAGILSAIDIEKLKIFYVHKESVDDNSVNLTLPEKDLYLILNSSYNSHGEAWFELSIDNQQYLFFALKFGKSDSRIVVVGREIKNLTWNLSDFFKIFFIHVILILVAVSIVSVVNYPHKKINISYRSKLISIFLLVSIVPLFLVAAYIRNLTESKNKELLYQVLSEKCNQIENYLMSYLGASNLNVNMIAEKAAIDLNINFALYDSSSIIYSSNKMMYDAGLLNSKLNPEIFLDLLLNNGKTKMTTERVENTYMNAMFHRVQFGEKKYIIEINDMFNKIVLPLSDVELDIFLFGIFSFAVVVIITLSTILSGQISSPIRKLTRATRAVATGDLSVEVDIKQSGEVKELADGFNMMVGKIKQNQMDIAEFEREEAWKEMAKQVAHEIKNPLTPMKLSVQQLITAYNDKSPKFDSIFEKVTSTVIAQVDVLKNIALEFSNFARMPRLNIERINLAKNVREALNLFSDEKQKIEFKTDGEEIYINADTDHLKRTVVNLIRNALQAGATIIFVNMETKEDKCFLKISDNGSGISEESRALVFNENYTTKKSGMGLGLSMAKKFIESIQGEITIESTSSSGTTFLITLPVAGK